MPKRDQIHENVRTALENDGWEILYDPLFVPVTGLAGLYIDLAARELIGASKNGRRIVIEIKDFTGQSFTREFYEALGQVLVYRKALAERNIDWQVFLAVSRETYSRIEKVPLFLQVLEGFDVNLLVVDLKEQRINLWLIQKNTER